MVGNLRNMQHMAVTYGGILQWTLNTGAVPQFKNIIMFFSKGPTPHSTMYAVYKTMEGIWDLRVFYPCRGSNPDRNGHSGPYVVFLRCGL